MIEAEMVELNNQRRKLLNEANRKYYEDILVYLRMSRIPSKQTEELLLEMLDHLLTAQQKGKTAKDLFGEDPEAYCEEIVQSMGKAPAFSWTRYLFIFNTGMYVVFLINAAFQLIINPLLNRFWGVPYQQGFSIDWFLIPVFGATLVEMTLFFLRKTVFSKGIKRLLWMILPPVAVFSGFLILYLYLKDTIPILPLSPWLILLLGGVFWLINKLGFRRVELW